MLPYCHWSALQQTLMLLLTLPSPWLLLSVAVTVTVGATPQAQTLCARQVRHLQSCRWQLHAEALCQPELNWQTADCLRQACNAICTSGSSETCATLCADADYENHDCRRLVEIGLSLDLLLQERRAPQCLLARNRTQPDAPFSDEHSLSVAAHHSSSSAHPVVRERRAVSRVRPMLPTCESATCNKFIVGYRRAIRPMFRNSGLTLNAAIKAKITGMESTMGGARIYLDEIIQLYPNDTHVHVRRRVPWPLNCTCPQIMPQKTFLIFAQISPTYRLIYFNDASNMMSPFVYEKHNFKFIHNDELRDKVEELIGHQQTTTVKSRRKSKKTTKQSRRSG